MGDLKGTIKGFGHVSGGLQGAGTLNASMSAPVLRYPGKYTGPTIAARCSTTYMSTARAAELDKANSIITITGKLYRQAIPGKVRQMYADLYERIV